MKAKTAKTAKQKHSNAAIDNPTSGVKTEVRNDDGFTDSKALNQREIENLKEQLEELNRENTTGG